MRKTLFLLSFLFLIIASGNAQNVGIGTATPNATAKLDVSSTNSGFLPPRMTYAQRNAITNPAAGLIIYCTDCANGEMQYYNGSNWMQMGVSLGSVPFVIPSVTICNQVWMQKNLDVSTYRNGDVIPQVTDANQWAGLTTGAWCWYDNDSATYASTYGKLYNWYAVNDARGLAPTGWHVPSKTEWLTLSICLGGDAVAGFKMKEAGAVHWINANTNNNNSSGFTGLPGGARYGGGAFSNLGYLGLFWSSTEASINDDFLGR